MVYSSYVFMLLFLPIVLVVYFLLSKAKNIFFQKLFIILASLFFYGYFNWNYLLLIITSLFANYLVATIIQKNKKKCFLTIGIMFNIALLGYFKYFDFFVTNINTLFKTSFALQNIILPLGISFFTFQQLSFLISVYKGEEVVEKIIDYCVFVTFFPQLVAGPIVLYSEMIPQFKDPGRRFFNMENFGLGLYLFGLGAFKKAVIADTVSLFADNGFGMTELGFVTGWATSLAYTMQIYFDFSGYSDMAIGLGKMFNIDIPENFNSPYKSRSISEFWRRWHITLGRALSTYVYIPLGGNRKGITRTYINLMLTFIISGIWHGAAWTFVLWGMIHGICVVIDRAFKKTIDKIPEYIRIALTFVTVNSLWVLFRAKSFSEALNVYKGMISIRNIKFYQLKELAYDSLANMPGIIDTAYVIGVILILLFIVFKRDNSMVLKKTFVFNTKTAIVTALFLFCSLIFISRGSVFIYFNF